jgi:hypothetical protein
MCESVPWDVKALLTETPLSWLDFGHAVRGDAVCRLASPATPRGANEAPRWAHVGWGPHAYWGGGGVESCARATTLPNVRCSGGWGPGWLTGGSNNTTQGTG